MLALQAVKRAAAIGGPGSPEAHCMVLRFCHAAQSEQVGSPYKRHWPTWKLL